MCRTRQDVHFFRQDFLSNSNLQRPTQSPSLSLSSLLLLLLLLLSTQKRLAPLQGVARNITMPSFLEFIGNVLLFGLVFGMSATVDIDCIKHQVRNKNAILLGIFCQFILLPFLGFVVVNLLDLEAPLGITLLVVTSSPGGSYSNWCVFSCPLLLLLSTY